MTAHVYVVIGSVGCYSDRSEWAVVAYDTQEAADAHARRATEALAEITRRGHDGDSDWIYYGEVPGDVRVVLLDVDPTYIDSHGRLTHSLGYPGDPSDGVRYCVERVELRRGAP